MAEYFVRPDGVVEGVYHEEISLEKMLEELEIIRASDCEFDALAGSWYAVLRVAPMSASGFERKSDAVRWEVEQLNSVFVKKHNGRRNR